MATTPIERIMQTREVASISPESAAFEALMLMTRKAFTTCRWPDAARVRARRFTTDLMRAGRAPTQSIWRA